MKPGGQGRVINSNITSVSSGNSSSLSTGSNASYSTQSSGYSTRGGNPLDQQMDPFREGVFTSTEDYIESLSRRIVFQQQHAAMSSTLGGYYGMSKSSGSSNSTGGGKLSSSGTGGLHSSSGARDAGSMVDDENVFDSTPYEDVFETTLSQLTQLRKHVDNKLDTLAKDCAVREKDYKTKLAEIQRKFDVVFKNFKGFDSTINKVSNSAQRIGVSLEIVESHRNRAIETQIFLNYIVQLNDDQAKLYSIFGDTSDVENAILLKNLLILATELDMPATTTAKNNIETMARNLERTQLDRFIIASRTGKFQIMKDCAKTLYELNGGEECIKSYINQLPMFFVDDMTEILEDTGVGNRISIFASASSLGEDSNGISPSSSESNLASSSSTIDTPNPLSSSASESSSSILLNNSAPNIGHNGRTSPLDDKLLFAPKQQKAPQKLAFNPNYPHARQDIQEADTNYFENMIKLDRFYEKVVLGIREEFEVITKVFPSPPLVLMKLTQRVFEQRIHQFIEDLLHSCLPDLELYLQTLGYAFEKVNQVVTDLSSQPTSMLPAALSTFADAVFVKHRDDFIGYQVSSMTAQLVKEQQVEDDSPKAIEERNKGKKVPFKPIQLDVDMTIRCLEYAEIAAERCATLSHTRFLPENMFKIFQTLLREFGRNIMLESIQQSIKRISTFIASGENSYHMSLSTSSNGGMNPKNNPKAPKLSGPPQQVLQVPVVSAFFELVQNINTNVVLLQKHYFVKIRPFVEGSRNEQTLCQSDKNRLLQLLEDQIEAGLDKSLQVLVNHVDLILSKEQRPKDFKPPQNEIANIDLQHASETCLLACTFIRSQHSILSNALDGRNLQAFLTEFASRTLQIILKHIKKFTIDQGIGAFCLMRDLSEFQECVATFNIMKVSNDFEILKAIAKLHLVGPEQIADVVSDSMLAKWSKPEIESYIRTRSDFDKTWIGKYI